MRKSTPIGQEEKPGSKPQEESDPELEPFFFPVDQLGKLGFFRSQLPCTGAGPEFCVDANWKLGYLTIPRKYLQKGHVNLIQLLANAYDAGVKEGHLERDIGSNLLSTIRKDLRKRRDALKFS